MRSAGTPTWQLALKSCIDRVGALVLGIASLPILAVAAVLIKLDTPGPVFFRQRRVGRNGVPFTLVKLRTMVVGAEDDQLRLSESNIMKGPVFKLRNDPRVTAVGYWLRRTSVDEIPQFWNVLLGQMSLVGPRPPTRGEVERYAADERRRLSMKPGITGLWQVSGRSEITDFDEILALDLAYIDRWSLLLDLWILLRTLPVVITMRGAM